jgi:hypothetical protein
MQRDDQYQLPYNPPNETPRHIAPEVTSQFINRLVLAVPEFESVYRDHLRDQEGELLPHVLMGDFTRWFRATYLEAVGGSRTSALAQERLHRSADFLESAWQREEAAPGYSLVSELLSVSFLENLLGEPEYDGVKEVLGPGLRSQLAIIAH